MDPDFIFCCAPHTPNLGFALANVFWTVPCSLQQAMKNRILHGITCV